MDHEQRDKNSLFFSENWFWTELIIGVLLFFNRRDLSWVRMKQDVDQNVDEELSTRSFMMHVLDLHKNR